MQIIRTGTLSFTENSSPASEKLHDLHHMHSFCGLRQGAHKKPVSVLYLRTNPCTGPYQLSSTSFKTNTIRRRSWDCDRREGWGHSTPSWTAEFSLHCCIQGSSHHLVENQKLMTIHKFPSSSTCVKAVARPLGNQIMCWKRTIILFYSRDGQDSA